MIRRPLRPLARILRARAEGQDPDLVEAEERAARLAERHRAERAKAETRLLLLGVVFILGFSTVAGRMALVSGSLPVEPRAGGVGEPIHTQRADIVDRNGVVLATNIATASLYAQPKDLIDPSGAAIKLAAIFPDLDADTLASQFTDGRKFLWIKRTISPEQRQRVHDIGEPGLLFGPRETRLYPNGAVAAHVLGGASFGREGVDAAEVVGTAGVERVFDARLRDPAVLSDPLRLSIDIRVQTALEDVLAQGMSELRAKGAVGILMEARTGQIAALASLPDFDPNNRPALPTSGDPADSPLFNRAAQGRYELGSTFKPLTVAMGLEAGLISPQTMIDTKGPMKWGRFTIRDFHNYGPRLTVEDVLVNSSNIGSAHIGLMVGAARQKAFFEKIGMMQPSPVELTEAARTAPLLPKQWSDLSTITISYGHGMAVTPLHLAAAYASLVNGGLRVKPSIIAGEAPPTEADRVVSERTSRQIRSMLRQVVVRGTAERADVAGYDVAGKTGTADKPNARGGYARDKTIATFASFFPASDPRYVLVICLDEPTTVINNTSFRTAGLTAAPVLAHAIRRIAPALGMRPAEPARAEVPLLYTLAGNH
ncbi:cell division protein FtsI (penicillin-binding protein 3) [Amaricoccus macauensis]|uniref:Cell division protein FtsI (Penicillin-binding protein 3) n=1 Tax=Amaricoccus macauensis TaxID=57001 RepID=A0A840STH9_9RHOB|nr:penicillin-binding protein 2 [Amaricoccus macauensis]MBB5223815.1 cell division protein FtsI (penicillin-binding protein 3) [Amaricoccus macauensis]